MTISRDLLNKKRDPTKTWHTHNPDGEKTEKKHGAGKNNWGTVMDQDGPEKLDPKDPDYDSEAEK